MHAFGVVQAVRKVKYLEQSAMRSLERCLVDNGHVLVPYFFDVEQSTSSAHIGFPKIFDSVNDGGANSECDTVVIGLADTSNSGNIGPLKDMLSRIYDKPWLRCGS